MAIARSWVLTNVLAVGSAPRTTADLEQLAREKVRAVLTLCSPEEVRLPQDLRQLFHWERVAMPDDRCGHPPTPEHLAAALVALERLRQCGPVYVHCLAGVERSPLVSAAWLMRERGLSRLQALDYLMQVHPITNPMPEQLAVLSAWEPRTRAA
jgi:protein-tyrosine phosphatase